MVRPRTPRRVELGEFLSARRRSASRADRGLPVSPRRGDTGLSREEVAALAGISVSWYTWLEQGRDTGVSHQVLLAVARVLALSDDEVDYVLGLAERGESPARPVRYDAAPAHLMRLIERLDFPAFILTPGWAILGWNAAYRDLYPRVEDLAPADRNLLWLVYTDPDLRRMLPDWERDTRRFLAEFRAEAGVRVAEDDHRAVLDRLAGASELFREHAAELEVAGFASRRRDFHHPRQGPVSYDHHRLVPSDASDLHIVMYVPTTPTP
ncbi:MAG: helix-turn-helix transcriptional regulator [Actinomycetaceae bacterium]